MACYNRILVENIKKCFNREQCSQYLWNDLETQKYLFRSKKYFIVKLKKLHLIRVIINTFRI